MSSSPVEFDPNCPLCAAERYTTWYHEDDLCWIAECESCSVPMVVWKRHDPNPPEEVRVELIGRLRIVADQHAGGAWWVDDTLRSIPTHYHAHARRRW
jgi:hypothetical protein